MMKKKVLLTSILAIVCCVSLMVGATFALFTSESEVNIAVTSGKVSVVATVGEVNTFSAVADDAGTLVDENGNKYSYAEQTAGTFANGGTAVVGEDGTLTLANVTPGDKAEITVNVTNTSTVNVMYRATAKNADAENVDLFNALVVDAQPGGLWTPWATPADQENGEVKTLTVTVELPISAQDVTLQGKTANIAVLVEAVQANANLGVDVANQEVAIDETTNAVASNTEVKAGDVTATIQQGTKLVANSVTVNSTKSENPAQTAAENNIKAGKGNTLATAYEVEVEGLAEDNTVPVVATFNVGENLDVANVYHKGVKMTAATTGEDQTYTYDATSGNVTVYTTTFSPFMVEVKFAGGLGTAEHPYLISNAEQFKAMESGTSKGLKYYQLANDISLEETDAASGESNPSMMSYYSKKLKYIHFNGDGKNIKSNSDAFLFDYLLVATIKNLNAHVQNTLIIDSVLVDLENVNVYGDMIFGNNQGVYVIYPQHGLTMKNCTNFANVNADGSKANYNAVFVGYPLSNASVPQTLRFENCWNAGKFTSGLAAMFVANGSQSQGNTTALEIVNCGNAETGVIRGTVEKENGKINPFCAIIENNLGAITVDGQAKEITDYDAMGAGFENGPEDVMNLSLKDDGTFTFNKSKFENVHHYVVTVAVYTSWHDGGSLIVSATETIQATDASTYTTELQNLAFVDQAWVDANQGATAGTLAGNATYTLDGTTYYFITVEGSNVGGKAKAAMMISVSAYAEDGTLISSVALVA